MSKLIKSDAFVTQWAEAMGIDIAEDKITRVVIDAQVGEVLKVYLSRWGTDRLLDVTPPDASGVEVTVL